MAVKSTLITLDKFQLGYQTHEEFYVKQNEVEETQFLSGQQGASAAPASTNSPTPGSCAAVISSPNERKMPDALSPSQIHI